MDLVIASRCLPAKLVAGNIQDFKPLFMIVSVQLLNRLVLRRKAAAGSCVNNENNLAPIVCKIQLFTFAGKNCVIY